MRKADDEARREALDFVKGIRRSRSWADDTPKEIDLGAALAAALADWPSGKEGQGVLCVVCYQKAPKFNPQLLERLPKREAGRPQIHFLGEHKVQALGRLAKESGGKALLLEEDNLRRRTAPKEWEPDPPK